MAEEYFHRGRGPAYIQQLAIKNHEGGCGAKLLDTIFFHVVKNIELVDKNCYLTIGDAQIGWNKFLFCLVWKKKMNLHNIIIYHGYTYPLISQ